MVGTSTQCGADWMVSAYSEVHGTELLDLSDALDELVALLETASLEEAEEDRDDDGLLLNGYNAAAASSSRICLLQAIIAASIHQHTLPPVAMGYGCGSLRHKLQ